MVGLQLRVLIAVPLLAVTLAEAVAAVMATVDVLVNPSIASFLPVGYVTHRTATVTSAAAPPSGATTPSSALIANASPCTHTPQKRVSHKTGWIHRHDVCFTWVRAIGHEHTLKKQAANVSEASGPLHRAVLLLHCALEVIGDGHYLHI
jgi:hypothetical protein